MPPLLDPPSLPVGRVESCDSDSSAEHSTVAAKSMHIQVVVLPLCMPSQSRVELACSAVLHCRSHVQVGAEGAFTVSRVGSQQKSSTSGRTAGIGASSVSRGAIDACIGGPSPDPPRSAHVAAVAAVAACSEHLISAAGRSVASAVLTVHSKTAHRVRVSRRPFFPS